MIVEFSNVPFTILYIYHVVAVTNAADQLLEKESRLEFSKFIKFQEVDVGGELGRKRPHSRRGAASYASQQRTSLAVSREGLEITLSLSPGAAGDSGNHRLPSWRGAGERKREGSPPSGAQEGCDG